jgi:hypothetical protein
MSLMASFLNKQKHESLDALACAADAEGRLHTANERRAYLPLSSVIFRLRTDARAVPMTGSLSYRKR